MPVTSSGSAEANRGKRNGSGPVSVEENDILQCGALAPNLFHGFQPILCGQHHLGVRVADNVLELPGAEKGAAQNGHGPDAEGRERRHNVFRMVVRAENEGIPAPDAHILKGTGESAEPVVEPPEGDPLLPVDKRRVIPPSFFDPPAANRVRHVEGLGDLQIIRRYRDFPIAHRSSLGR